MTAKLYVIALSIFLALDMVWLGVIARNFYKNQIGFLLRTDVHWLAAIIFYLLFIAGLIVFVVQPALTKQSSVHALLFGAFFGLVTYATYDLTNLATVKNWPLLVTVVDLLWGTFLAATVSVFTYHIANTLGI